jgi:uncharacterized damage-inducible protein DinB
MKIITLSTVFFFISCISFIAQAQTSIDEIVKEWERAKAYTQEYLDAMPESDYGLKPTTDMRSFAGQMLHLTDGNYGFASTATGEDIPSDMEQLEKTADTSKENVMTLVLEGYDYVINSIKKLTPTQLNDKVVLFGRFEMTREAALAKAFEHQTHHRGQTTVYLRLAGVKPPQEKLF